MFYCVYLRVSLFGWRLVYPRPFFLIKITMSKKSINKGTDKGMLLEILMNDDLRNLSELNRLNEVKKAYNNILGKTSKETVKGYVREDIIVLNKKNRFITKLPQDLKKLDLMVAHKDGDEIIISLIQLKGQNSSFNSTSEPKTLESMSDCYNKKTYTDFFELLPDDLNPNINNKKYKVDMVIGMVNATGEKIKENNGVKIKYLSGDKFLLYLGLEIDTIDLANQINNDTRVINHTYDAVSKTDDWYDVYKKCLEKLNYA